MYFFNNSLISDLFYHFNLIFVCLKDLFTIVSIEFIGKIMATFIWNHITYSINHTNVDIFFDCIF